MRTPGISKLAVILVGIGCALRAEPAAIEVAGIRNAFRINDRILSGSEPEDDAAFAALAQIGVKTIISVDGTRPAVETARKFGLRYVHLPFGYDGIPTERVAQLAKAATTLPGAIFVHCHHGKHRGPAAVAILCAASAGWTHADGEAWLRAAGTAADYSGLYRSVREFRPIAEADLARLGPLPEITKPDPLVDAMVAIDEWFDVVKAAQKVGWKSSADQRADSPAHAATLLWEGFRELVRADDTARLPAGFRVRLAESERAADALRAALHVPKPDIIALDAAFARAGQSCVDCHKAFRNEKK